MNKLITELQRLYFLPDQQWHRQQLDHAGKPAYPAAGVLTPAIMASSLAGETNVALQLLSGHVVRHRPASREAREQGRLAHAPAPVHDHKLGPAGGPRVIQLRPLLVSVDERSSLLAFHDGRTEAAVFRHSSAGRRVTAKGCFDCGGDLRL